MQTLTVYAGSSGFAPQSHNDAARQLGAEMATRNINLCYGGMNAGLMYLVAEGCRRAGGHVVGIIPTKLRDSERVHRELKELITVDNLWERKREMYYHADGFIALPGGFGTYDEVAEVLYWGVLGFHKKPMLLLNIDGYWDDFIAQVLEHSETDKDDLGTISDFLVVADNVEDGLEKIAAWTAPAYAEQRHDRNEHLPHYEDEFSDDKLDSIIIDHPSANGLYQLGSALTLRQLGKHSLPIGLINKNGSFDALLRWIDLASDKRYITAKCSDLYAVANDETALKAELADMKAHQIDLHEDKWGEKPEF